LENILKFYEKAITGKKCDENTFNFEILPKKLKELEKKYDVKYSPNEAVPQDLGMAKRTFEAAKELLLDIGVYCSDSKRIIEIEEDDIANGINSIPKKVIIGENEQTIECYSRNIEDNRRPLIIGGPNGAPMSEENYIKILTSYALEPIDGLHTGSLQSLFGRKIRATEPIEFLACKFEAIWAREAIRRAGKPGLSITGIMSGVTSEAQNGGDFDGGLRTCDKHLIVLLNELKVDWGVFNKVIHNHNLGNSIDADVGGPIIGGMSGGPATSAITGVAEMILCYLLTKPSTVSLDSHHMMHGWSHKWAIWTNCLVVQAFVSSGIPAILGYYLIGSAGPCTEMLIDEIAAEAIALTSSGASFFVGPGGRLISVMDYFTGMESRILYEISRASSGLSLNEADKIVKRLIKNYEDILESKKIPPGKNFLDCYDQKNMKVTPEYLSIWKKKKNELKEFGLEFD